MVLANPCFDVPAKRLSEFPHFLGFRFGNGVSPFVVRDVALLAEDVELSNCGRG